MPYFMRQRKPLAPIRAILVDRDDGSVDASDNPRFTALQLAITDASAEMERNRLEVDLLRAHKTGRHRSASPTATRPTS